MFNVGLAFAVLDLTGSASDLGLVLAARTVPQVVLLLMAGVFSDRLPRRRVMVAADLVRLGSHGTMAALVVGGSAHVWMLAVLAAGGGSATAFFVPAATGLLPSVVAPEQLQPANALRALTVANGEIIGPILAGVIIAGTSPGWALAADAGSFGVSAALLSRLRLPRETAETKSSFLFDLRVGWHQFRSRRWLVAIVATASLGNLLFASFNVLGPLVAARSFGGAAAWAVILSALGVGSVAGSLIALRLDPSRPALVATLTVSLFALPLAFLATAASFALTALSGLAAGAGLTVANTLWETTVQRHIPTPLLSRVSAYSWFGSIAFQPIGFATWGPVALAIGTSSALWVAFGLQLASTLGLLVVPEVRRLPRHPVTAAASLGV